MNIDIERLITYPTNSDDWILTVLIGGVASLFGFLIIPLFLVSGYLVRAIRAGMAEAEEPPVFDAWGELLKEGFVATIITFVYQLIPLIVFGTIVGGSVAAIAQGSEVGSGIGLFGLIGGTLLWWLLAVIFGYIGFAGVANYAREGTFAAGFDAGVIMEVITSREYLLAWLYVVLLNIVVGVVSGVLNIVPFLGAVVGVFLGFYALIIAGWLWGNGFAAATGTSREAEPPTEAATG